jgi:putative membrane protein insertion efficiency factor
MALLSDLPRRCLMALVRGYRLFLSPWLGSACRFEPTCSAYALQAIERHGALAGSALTVARLARCHPWGAAGHDPVPAAPPRLFRHLIGGGADAASERRPGRPSSKKTSP